jgi:serine/threonine-protein phosphatase 4 regulatory subunit 1
MFIGDVNRADVDRAYVARSLGDLLLDVDPCETVEYVMPLLSGFTMDNGEFTMIPRDAADMSDESVKEAFASEIHKILWFFFAVSCPESIKCPLTTKTCRLVSEDDMDAEEPEEDPETTTVTMTSAGLAIVPATVAIQNDINTKVWSGYDEDETPESTTGSTISDSTLQTPSSIGVFSPGDDETARPSPHLEEEIAPIISRPSIPVQFFTPILGSMLLSQNNMVADPARAAVVAIIARLQGKEQAGLDPWGPARTDDLRRAYASQTGPHVHDRHPFSDASKHMVERELVQGIVLGMGKLDTELPEQSYPSGASPDPGGDKAGIEHDDDGYPLLDDEDETAQSQYLLEQEAPLGRAISINLIASISEFYTGTEIADRGFIDPVLKSAGDELGVKTEAALALAYLAKVAPVKYIDDMVCHEHKIELTRTVAAFRALCNRRCRSRQAVCLSLPARTLPKDRINGASSNICCERHLPAHGV